MAKTKIDFINISKEDFEAHLLDRQKLAAYYEKKGYESLVEISPQAYIAYINGELWDVYREEEIPGDDKWMARSSSNPNGAYLDPMPTLKVARAAVFSMRTGTMTPAETSKVVKTVRKSVEKLAAKAKAEKPKVEKVAKEEVKLEPKYKSKKLTRDLHVEVCEDSENREHADIVIWSAGHIIKGQEIVEITESHTKVRLDYGIAWVPNVGLVDEDVITQYNGEVFRMKDMVIVQKDGEQFLMFIGKQVQSTPVAKWIVYSGLSKCYATIEEIASFKKAYLDYVALKGEPVYDGEYGKLPE